MCIRDSVYSAPAYARGAPDRRVSFPAYPGPVSYTHLDVYKRQDHDTAPEPTGFDDEPYS